MAYQKKTWKNRLAEFPNRRRLEPTGIENTYDVARAEGNISVEGDKFNAPTMNDLEQRIADGFADVAAAAVPSTRTVNGHALSANVTVTAADVGLGSVNNTPDASKSVNYANSAGAAANTTSIAGALTVTTAEPSGTLAVGKLWGVY